MIYVFYNNDPLCDDQGGGAEHFRGIFRMLQGKNTNYSFIASRMCIDKIKTNKHVTYISTSAHFGKYYLNLIKWFFKNRNRFSNNDTFHFHRNYGVWPKFIFANKLGNTIITYHNTTGLVLAGKLGNNAVLIRKAMVFFERKALKYANKIIYVSDRDRQNMRDILGNNYTKTSVIPAAFDSRKFKQSSLPIINLSNKVLTIGRMSHQKNFILAIEAFEEAKNKHPDLSLTIAGDGELKDEILIRIRFSKYKSSINYIGLIEHDKVPTLIAEHGIVLVSSRYEASPTIVKEAIASRRPVVTTDVGDVNLWVVSGKNGFICNHNNTELSNGLLKAVDIINNQSYEQSIDLELFSEKNIMNSLFKEYI